MQTASTGHIKELSADAFNPAIAARLIEPLGVWRRYTPELGALMKAELDPKSIVDTRYATLMPEAK